MFNHEQGPGWCEWVIAVFTPCGHLRPSLPQEQLFNRCIPPHLSPLTNSKALPATYVTYLSSLPILRWGATTNLTEKQGDFCTTFALKCLFHFFLDRWYYLCWYRFTCMIGWFGLLGLNASTRASVISWWWLLWWNVSFTGGGNRSTRRKPPT